MSSTVEEFERTLDSIESDIEKIKLMNSFSYKELKERSDYALKLTERAILLSEKIGYRQGVAAGISNKGFHSFYKVNDRTALSYMEESVKIYRELPALERDGFAAVLNGLGCIKMNMGELSEAAKIFREALNLSEESEDNELLGKIYTNLSSINEQLGNYENSFQLSLKALHILENSNDYSSYAIALNNIADTVYKMDRFDEAIYYLLQAKKVVEERGVLRLRGTVYLTLGELYQNIGRLEEAEENQLKALKYNILHQDSSMITKSYYQLGSLYLVKGNRRRALKYLQKAFRFAEERAANHMIRDISHLIFEIYNKSGNFKKALPYFELYYSLKEQNFNLEVNRTVRNAESESLGRANERIKAISAIGREIASTIDLKILLETVYERVNSLVDAYNFGIASYDRRTGIIDYNVYVKGNGFLPPMTYDVANETTLASYAIRKISDIFINDVLLEYKEYIDSDEIISIHSGDETNSICRSLLFTPLLIEDEVVGVVSVQSVKVGAYNQNDMDTLKALASYIAIALNNSRQAELIKEKNEELKRLAITDYLTGIYNRREFECRIRAFWSHSARKSSYFSIIILDADHFKMINDTYGHPAGDECLKELARLLKKSVTQPDDCLARYGGEEFIILLNCPEREAMKRAHEIRREIEEHRIEYGGRTLTVTVSIGVSSALAYSLNSRKGPEQLISRADEALYRSKLAGRNRVTYLPLH